MTMGEENKILIKIANKCVPASSYAIISNF
jgi:hypothetical protein